MFYIPIVGTFEFNQLIDKLERQKGAKLTKKERRYVVQLSHRQHADAFKAQKTRTHSALLARKLPRKIKRRGA